MLGLYLKVLEYFQVFNQDMSLQRISHSITLAELTERKLPVGEH
jgi:hypothetical protein